MQSSRPAPKLRNVTADTVKAALEAIGKKTKNSHLTKEGMLAVIGEACNLSRLQMLQALQVILSNFLRALNISH
jgi:hypothetical protein